MHDSGFSCSPIKHANKQQRVFQGGQRRSVLPSTCASSLSLLHPLPALSHPFFVFIIRTVFSLVYSPLSICTLIRRISYAVLNPTTREPFPRAHPSCLRAPVKVPRPRRRRRQQQQQQQQQRPLKTNPKKKAEAQQQQRENQPQQMARFTA